jgi:type II secretory pathway pseudopilin PulG
MDQPSHNYGSADTNEHKLKPLITRNSRILFSCSHGSACHAEARRRRVSRSFASGSRKRLPANHANKREYCFETFGRGGSPEPPGRLRSIAPTSDSINHQLSAINQHSCAAFTLVELLIATGITVAMVLMLGLMLGSLMSSASHATERVDAFRDARAALQMIERDLRNLVRTQWSPDPFSSPTPTPGTSRPVTLLAAYFAVDNLYSDPAPGNQQLYALVADQTTPSSGDVCAVGYYCRWDDQLHAYSLRRFFRGSGDTRGVMLIAQNTGYAADSVLYTPVLSDPVLAAYVWNFKVTMYDAAGTVINTYPYICDLLPAAPPPIPKRLPAAIEISFNAMSPQAARTVMSVTSSPNDWMDTTTQNYQRLIMPHTYQFRSRINLP